MHSKQASPIQVPQYCRIGQFMTSSGIFFPGSSPSWGTIHAWIEDRCLPVKRIGKTNYIDMKALSQRLARQALGNGFRYVMEETELVKLSLFPKGTDLFDSSSCPCRRTVYNWEKNGMLCILCLGSSRFVDLRATRERLQREYSSSH
ncbi:hypothetical protein GAX94_24775 [Phocaeicola vulgatus]|nr:hypothetical protein GAX94_24775 [Phocaeicola vulgatus]